MSEEERTTSENTIIASVIASQAAINAVAVASATTVRTATPTGGGPNVPSNNNIKLYKRRNLESIKRYGPTIMDLTRYVYCLGRIDWLG